MARGRGVVGGAIGNAMGVTAPTWPTIGQKGQPSPFGAFLAARRAQGQAGGGGAVIPGGGNYAASAANPFASPMPGAGSGGGVTVGRPSNPAYQLPNGAAGEPGQPQPLPVPGATTPPPNPYVPAPPATNPYTVPGIPTTTQPRTINDYALPPGVNPNNYTPAPAPSAPPPAPKPPAPAPTPTTGGRECTHDKNCPQGKMCYFSAPGATKGLCGDKGQ